MPRSKEAAGCIFSVAWSLQSEGTTAGTASPHYCTVSPLQPPSLPAPSNFTVLWDMPQHISITTQITVSFVFHFNLCFLNEPVYC